MLPLSPRLSIVPFFHTHKVLLALMAGLDITMQPAHSSTTTPPRGAALGQCTSGPATQETFAVQTATPHLSWEEGSKDPIQPQDCKLEPVVRRNISGFQNKSKKPLRSSQLPKISLQKILPESLDYEIKLEQYHLVQ